MNVIDTIQERLDNGYGGNYGDVLNDLSTVLILFRAKNKAIEDRIGELQKDKMTLIKDRFYPLANDFSSRIDELKNLLK